MINVFTWIALFFTLLLSTMAITGNKVNKMTDKKLVGYFSQNAFDKTGGFHHMNGKPCPRAAVYSTPEGDEVIVTEVVEEGKPPTSQWDDLISVGTVVKFLKQVD